MIPDRSSPSRVRFAASRPGLLRADPRGDAVHEGKGGGWAWLLGFGPCERAGREPFGHTSRLEPQRWGGVTRRAVAQRRSRVSGLTRLSAEAIRGFGVGFCRSVSHRSAAVFRKSFVFSLLPIGKVLVLTFLRARQRPSSCGLPLFSVSLSTAVVAPTTCSLYYLIFNYLSGDVNGRRFWARCDVNGRRFWPRCDVNGRG